MKCQNDSSDSDFTVWQVKNLNIEDTYNYLIKRHSLLFEQLMQLKDEIKVVGRECSTRWCNMCQKKHSPPTDTSWAGCKYKKGY